MKTKLLTISAIVLVMLACSVSVNMVNDTPDEAEVTAITDTHTPPAPTEITATDPPPPTETPAPTETAPATETPIPTPTEVTPDETQPLVEAADAVMLALHERDMEALATFVHPIMGVRFSPYTYVEEDHLVFMPEELPGLLDYTTDEVYIWGAFDGTGDPIEMPFYEYYDRFVYSAYFINPEEKGINEEIGWSSMINNIDEFYPSSQFVEYHFSGFSPQYGGMDWRSLRLVFIEEEGTWWLVGIVHDEWTI